ncbi:MAG: hypothetical protein ACRCYQ_03970 [Nocardioides sp.]
MSTETVVIMIVGLLAIGLIRFIIARVGREFAADHPHVKSRRAPRLVRGTGRKSHLLYLPGSEQAQLNAAPPMRHQSTSHGANPS